MPFRYVVDSDKKPILPKGLKEVMAKDVDDFSLSLDELDLTAEDLSPDANLKDYESGKDLEAEKAFNAVMNIPQSKTSASPAKKLS